MVEFEDFSPLDDSLNAKGTVHKNGKIGFSAGANKLMNFDQNRTFKISRNVSDGSDNSLYMIPAGEDDPKAFRVSKAGNYYYLRVKSILEKLRINYIDNKVIFDISEDAIEGVKFYKLTMRIKKKKKVNQ